MAPVHISELQTDPRALVETFLKKWCQTLIDHLTKLVISHVIHAPYEIEQLIADKVNSEKLSPMSINNRASAAYRDIKQNWPQIRMALALYIGIKETEDILLLPVKKAIFSTFDSLSLFCDNYFDEEQRQIASIPSQEQLSLVLNASLNS